MLVELFGWNKPLSEPVGTLERDIQYTGKKISVVIPTKDQGDTIEHTILSIVNQNYQNYEIIVVDGGSSDGTGKILDRYKSWINYCVREEDKGQSDAINKGFRLATGDIYAWINSDDYYLPGAFSRVVSVFENNQNIDIVVGSGIIVTKELRFLKSVDSMKIKREELLQWEKGRWVMQQSCFWTSELWKRVGGVDENLDLLMDFDLWLRFAEVGESKDIPDCLAAMRYYPEAKTVSLKEKMKEETAYVYAKNAAYQELREMVRNLVVENKQLTHGIEQENKRVVNRVIRLLSKVIRKV